MGGYHKPHFANPEDRAAIAGFARQGMPFDEILAHAKLCSNTITKRALEKMLSQIGVGVKQLAAGGAGKVYPTRKIKAEKHGRWSFNAKVHLALLRFRGNPKERYDDFLKRILPEMRGMTDSGLTRDHMASMLGKMHLGQEQYNRVLRGKPASSVPIPGHLRKPLARARKLWKDEQKKDGPSVQGVLKFSPLVERVMLSSDKKSSEARSEVSQVLKREPAAHPAPIDLEIAVDHKWLKDIAKLVVEQQVKEGKITDVGSIPKILREAYFAAEVGVADMDKIGRK